MPARIQRKRIINRRTSQQSAVDPAQNGAYYARVEAEDGGKLTITGIRGQALYRTHGVLAAKWENEETILLVVREEAEDDPVVIHAFKSRLQHLWETEDFHAAAHSSPDGKFLALAIAMPNPAVAVLPSGRVSRDYAARTNLGAPAESVAWSDDGKELVVTTDAQVQTWSPGKQQFKKTPRRND